MDNNSEYISLQEATQCCNYSQEYLALRARQGKLKAVKFGRNWVTKKEWLEEYLEKVEKYNNNLNAKNVVARGPLKAGGRREGWSPPGNLPISEVEPRKIRPAPLVCFGFVVALVFVLLITGIFYGRESFKIVYRDLDPYVREISEASDSAAKEIFEDTKNFYSQVPPLVVEFNENFDKGVVGLAKDISSYTTYIVGGAGDIIVENTIEILADTISDIPQTFATVSLTTASIGNVFKEYGQWLGKSISEWFSSQTKEIVQNYLAANEFVEEKISWGTKQMVDGTKMIGEGFEIFSQNLNSKFKTQTSKLAKGYFTANNFVERKISQGYKIVTQFWRAPEKIVEEKLIPKPGEEGIVLIPSTEKDEEVKEKIKEAFSDEVKVEPKDKISGIITPIFKEGEGQKYLYILVPVKGE